MSPITTHVLDTSLGRPAAGIEVILERQTGETWRELARGRTNTDGRIADLLPDNPSLPGAVCRLRFLTEAYFQARGVPHFYPEVHVIFHIAPASHFHVPLLLSPYGYSTYRGS